MGFLETAAPHATKRTPKNGIPKATPTLLRSGCCTYQEKTEGAEGARRCSHLQKHRIRLKASGKHGRELRSMSDVGSSPHVRAGKQSRSRSEALPAKTTEIQAPLPPYPIECHEQSHVTLDRIRRQGPGDYTKRDPTTAAARSIGQTGIKSYLRYKILKLYWK